MHVAVLLLDNAISMPAVGAADILRKTAALHEHLTGGRSRRSLTVELVGESSRQVTGMAGLRVLAECKRDELRRADLILVPAIDDVDVVGSIERHRRTIDWLRRRYRTGADLASMCTGAFLLAETGLLAGRRATTHWAFHDLFRQRYRDVELLGQESIVDEGRLMTGGGATTFLSLVMYVVEKHLGAETARFASRMFLIDQNRPAQSAFAIFSPQKQHEDAAILRAQRLMEAKVGEALAIPDVARAVALSPRTFVRRFKAATGNTPIEYLQRTRVEAAKRRLESAARTVDEIALEVGYEDAASFRRIFTRHVGLAPLSYRKRYGRAALG
jgi:transcriptional regulator GlxA family with amidase domain